MIPQIKTLDDGIGFVTYTHEGYPILSTFKPSKREGQLPKVGLSLCSGCTVGCTYCFTRGYKAFKKLTSTEIINQFYTVKDQLQFDDKPFKVSFKQMGDPLVNPTNTMVALFCLRQIKPEYDNLIHFVVSTSAPKTPLNDRFFQNLNDFHAKVNLQFSLHTTSNEERARLSPHMPMMLLEEVAKVASQSIKPVTLNFVMLDGYEYSSEKVNILFDPDKVFIKINHLDVNTYTEASGLKDMNPDKVKEFTDGLKGFKWDCRHS